MAHNTLKSTLGGVAMIALLAGCMEGGLPLGQSKPEAETAAPSTRLVERDVEAPEVFQAMEKGLWDGRPSLGGVWVAHPDVAEPERVIIRNETNGKFVIGALFRRERETPGPRLAVSSDAAEALGMLAGAPADLNVVALRRQEVAEPEAAMPMDAAPLDGASDIETAALDPIAAAEAAIDAPVPGSDVIAAPAPIAPVAAPAPAPQASTLSKPYIQIGIFSVEANATRTADRMSKIGIVPKVTKHNSSGKTFWRVVVGPAANKSERTDLLAKVKTEGFTDAYFVTD